MRPQDIVIGEDYRLKSTPNYSYAKALKLLRPGEVGNPKKYIIVKCEHTIDKDGKFGFIRHFRPCDLIKPINLTSKELV